MNICEDVNEFVNSTIIDNTPDVIQYNSSHLIVDDNPIEVIPHSVEEVDHLIKSLNYQFYPMKCDSCIGTIGNMLMVFLDDKIMYVTERSEKDYEINDETVKKSNINSITHIENNNLYCTMMNEEDKVIYCLRSEESKKNDEIEIITKGNKLMIEQRNHIIDEYIKYINEITEKIIQHLENHLLTNSKRRRYLNEKNQKAITINTYPLNEKSSFIETINNNKMKYIILNGENIMKLESVIVYTNSTFSNSIYDKMNYKIELDTSYLKHEKEYSVLDGNIYYFMMPKDEDICYKSDEKPTGNVDYDKLKKSTFEEEEIIIQKSIDSINKVVNEVTLSIEEYNTRYGIANVEEEQKNNNKLVIYTGKEYVEMFTYENNVFRLVYQLGKDSGDNNKFKVEVLNGEKSQIKFDSKSSFIRKCNDEIDSSKSYSINEIKEICPANVLESILNNKMSMKLPMSLESLVNINEDKSIIRKLIIKTADNKTFERVLRDENRIELIDNIISTSLQTTKITLSNKYIMKNDVNNNIINYLSSKYIMSVNYDNDNSNYCNVIVNRINKTLIRDELTTFVMMDQEENEKEKENKQYNCFNFEDNEEYVYCMKNKVDDDFILDIDRILDDKSFDLYFKRENDNEIKIDEITELKDCYFNINNMIETEIEKEKEISEKYEEILVNNKRRIMNSNNNSNTDGGKDSENEEEDKIIDINGIYESNNNGYYQGIYITNNGLYQIIKIKKITLQVIYTISIIKNEKDYKIKILSVDEKNTGLYNEINEFKEVEIKDIPSQFSELLIQISVGKEYGLKELEKYFSLEVKENKIELVKCSEDNIKSILKIVILSTKPVMNKPFYNELLFDNNKLKVFYGKDLYISSEERDNNNYENSVQLNFEDENDQNNENVTYTKFYDDYYVFDVKNQVYSSNAEYIEYYKYISNIYTPSQYDDKIKILEQSLKYINDITKPIQLVIDNLKEPEVMNYSRPDDEYDDDGGDNGNGDGNGKGKYRFNTMEILAIVFGSLFVVIVFGFSVWSCASCYKDKKALKEIEMEEMNRVYREKNGFIPTSNKEFIKIQMMPKM